MILDVNSVLNIYKAGCGDINEKLREPVSKFNTNNVSYNYGDKTNFNSAALTCDISSVLDLSLYNQPTGTCSKTQAFACRYLKFRFQLFLGQKFR